MLDYATIQNITYDSSNGTLLVSLKVCSIGYFTSAIPIARTISTTELRNLKSKFVGQVIECDLERDPETDGYNFGAPTLHMLFSSI